MAIFRKKSSVDCNQNNFQEFPLVRTVKNLSDNELMNQVTQGQLDYLAVLYDRYQSPLYGFFTGMSQDKMLAADLVQNVFYRLLKYRHQFKGGQFKTWLYHIARNVFHDQYKRKQLTVPVVWDDLKDKIQDSYRTDHALHQNEEITQLNKALALLPEEKREIILLSKYQDKNYKEIGEILGCTEGNVKVKVFRAMNDLKALYFQV